MPTPATFVFATCQPDSNPWLKEDVLRSHPDLRFAFSRPGLLTFKCVSGRPPHFERTTPLARAWGYSIGRASSPAEVLALLEQFALPAKLRLHVFERDPKDLDALFVLGNTYGQRAQKVFEALRDAAPDRFHFSPVAEEGDWVLDVVTAPADDPEEPWLVGHHRHAKGRSPLPGGPQRVTPPPEAPSRAYAKLEEAAAWSGAPLGAGQTVVELGSAPGGATLAMLQRGMEVFGVDPAEMSPTVLNFTGPKGNRLHHLKKPAGAVVPADITRKVDWVVSDLNLAPPVALRYVDRLVMMFRRSMTGVVLTLKLNDDRMHRELPDFLTRVERFGFGQPQSIQLPSNRTEVAVVAFRGGSQQPAPSRRPRGK